MKTRLEHVLNEANLSGGVSTHLILQRRFQNLKFIDETKSISDFISIREYRLFMQDQLSGQFHSAAVWEDDFSSENIDEAVSNITKSDALWFCAWLSTQANIQPETGVYDYRPCDNYPGYSPLKVQRIKIPDRYEDLSNYLANGCWEEADEETLKIMLEISGLQKLGWLNNESIQEFPCKDIRTIDKLWVKFSGGKFGFSVQQRVYVETGNFLDGKLRKKEFEHFYKAVRWSSCDYQLASPRGHLPQRALKRGKISTLLFSCFGFFFLEGIGIPCLSPPRLSAYSSITCNR